MKTTTNPKAKKQSQLEWFYHYYLKRFKEEGRFEHLGLALKCGSILNFEDRMERLGKAATLPKFKGKFPKCPTIKIEEVISPTEAIVTFS